MIYRIRKPNPQLRGAVRLAGSKSISNRALIIRALSDQSFPIDHLANARDTELLSGLLDRHTETRYAGAAGTTFRFLTAYLAFQPGRQFLTGTRRMKERPIGILVDALNHLGAQIEYTEREGYPPLRIWPPQDLQKADSVNISAGTSSQYISALLMIAPRLPRGLTLYLENEVVSRPYIEMTLRLMNYFGVEHEWNNNAIDIPPQRYQSRPFQVEADWSAASYFYALAAFSREVDLQLDGLFEESVQGDAILVEMMKVFGVQSEFNERGVRLYRAETPPPETFEWDFVRCPDLAQTLAVVCAGLGIRGLFTGLETLRIKETDRIAALQRELAKVGVGFQQLSLHTQPGNYYEVSGKAEIHQRPRFATYEDHRMAMAFAPLAAFGEIEIQDPLVVDKSYPDYWKDLQSLEFQVE